MDSSEPFVWDENGAERIVRAVRLVEQWLPIKKSMRRQMPANAALFATSLVQVTDVPAQGGGAYSGNIMEASSFASSPGADQPEKITFYHAGELVPDPSGGPGLVPGGQPLLAKNQCAAVFRVGNDVLTKLKFTPPQDSDNWLTGNPERRLRCNLVGLPGIMFSDSAEHPTDGSDLFAGVWTDVPATTDLILDADQAYMIWAYCEVEMETGGAPQDDKAVPRLMARLYDMTNDVELVDPSIESKVAATGGRCVLEIDVRIEAGGLVLHNQPIFDTDPPASVPDRYGDVTYYPSLSADIQTTFNLFAIYTPATTPATIRLQVTGEDTTEEPDSWEDTVVGVGPGELMSLTAPNLDSDV